MGDLVFNKMGKIKDLTGQKFGRLTVIKYMGVNKWKGSLWLCRCECGNEIIATCSNLTKKNHTTSCGCYKRDKCTEIKTIHNQSHTRLYKIWVGIITRCENKNANSYYLYGAKGIQICEEWRKDFETFYNWSMANGYNDTLTIDRIDYSGNYEPSNCRWATNKEQANNKSQNRTYIINGEKYTCHQIAEKYNVNYGTFMSRLYRGFTLEEAIQGKRLR